MSQHGGNPQSGRAADPPPGARTRLSVPKSQDFLAVVRCVTMHIGARTTLPVPDVQDLRLAANEACILVLELSGSPHGTLECCFDELADGIALDVRAAIGGAPGRTRSVDLGSFGWNLLGALVDDLWWDASATSVGVHLVKHTPAEAMAGRF